MTDLEQRLRTGLARAAEDAPEDLDRLRTALRERLDASSSPRPRPLAARLAVPLAAGLAVVGATAGVSALLARDADREVTATPAPAPRGPVAARVSSTWACPVRRTVDLTRTIRDGPDRAPFAVHPGRAPAEATTYAVPRFDYELTGRTGTLAYGDGRGRRTAVTTLVREGDGTWRVRARTLCTGTGGDPSATSADAGALSPERRTPLRPPTRVPWPHPTPTHYDRPVDPARLVQVDNRTTYDQVGRQEPASTYAYVDGTSMFLLSAWGDTETWGTGGSLLVDRPLMAGVLPSAATQEPFVRLATDEAERGTAVPILARGTDLAAMELRAGDRVVRARSFGAPSWGRTRLFAALAPAGYRGDRLREVEIVLTDRAGRRTTHHLP